MDGLKLDKWQKSFEAEVKSLKTEYDAFLLPKKFEDTYQLKTDETNQTLSLWIDTENLPKEIENRLSELLIKTEPEDSV
ncbi:hypothetical protein ACFOW1_15580 [Parasediminibacterium paludis]|uniref:Uncharacterized protein n=1 Tax=Parasediminibacterium paludis TaxID=908966 RepID=A0ABV8PZA7_9BACT